MNHLQAPIYLDNHATTQIDERVLDAMLPFMRERFGNPASVSHAFGWEAEKAVSRAREQVAVLIGAHPSDIVFTSGATESDNLALKGVSEAQTDRGRHIVTCATEHKAVIDSARYLERHGCSVTYVPVNRWGEIDLALLKGALRPDTVLVSVMAVNNEIGTIQPVTEIGAIAHEHGCVFHCDAAQAVGKIALDVDLMNIDLLSVSAHKVYGPKGIGALYVRRRPRVPIAPLIDGGGHERGLRSGSLNVPGCVGLGQACSLALEEMDAEAKRISSFRDVLWDTLSASLDGVTMNGHPSNRLPGNLNVSFAGVDAETLMARVPEVAVSSGSACTSAAPEPSYVLRALGVSEELAYASIRFGLGRFNTSDEINFAAGRVIEEVRELRKIDGSANHGGK